MNRRSSNDNDATLGRFLKRMLISVAMIGGVAAPAFAAPGSEVPLIGSPYENAADAIRQGEDTQFQALFTQWKNMDGGGQGVMAVPSQQPTLIAHYTSGFGVRVDPFRGTAAMHAGVDMAAPIGTPIYATADGVVGRAGWAGGYGNLIELEHGRGLATRYGHLSQILVRVGQRIRRGELIAKMGSTGRSTGSHLHYEVRIDGRAVNPMPYLESADYLAAFRRGGTPAQQPTALGGPEDPGE